MHKKFQPLDLEFFQQPAVAEKSGNTARDSHGGKYLYRTRRQLNITLEVNQRQRHQRGIGYGKQTYIYGKIHQRAVAETYTQRFDYIEFCRALHCVIRKMRNAVPSAQQQQTRNGND